MSPHSPASAQAPSQPLSLPRRFECPVPGCGKLFRRKEHLTRHQKSHDSDLPHACHICGRRYARSDVLKRHVDFHPPSQYYKPRRNFIACIRCRESKIRCSENTPCTSCSRKSAECVRPDVEPHEAINNSETSSGLSVPQFSLQIIPEGVDLKQHVLSDTASAKRRFQIYFGRIHPTWPMLSTPKSLFEVYNDTLMLSIIMLASWVEGDGDHLRLAPYIFDQISDLHLMSDPPMHVLQTLTLYMVYCLGNLAADGMASRALKLHNTLISLCRCAGILNGQNGTWNIVRKGSATIEVEEQRNRLSLAVLRIDAYVSVMTDIPPLIRFQELSVPISTTTLWAGAANVKQARILVEKQPVMRKRTAFHFLVADMQGVPRQNSLAPSWTMMDYHFVLCALQSGVWESGHLALRSVVDELYSRSHHEHPRPGRRENLEQWLLSSELDCQLRTNYFAGTVLDDISPQTLLLYHMMALTCSSPVDLPQLSARYYKLRSILYSPDKDGPEEDYLQPWRESFTGRNAVFHAAQIARIVSRECATRSSTSRLVLNPLATPGLLLSAIMTCAYVYRLRVCPSCAGGPPVDIVNLFESPPHCQRTATWKEKGVGMANWGPDNFTILKTCHCSLEAIAGWFYDLLSLLAPEDKQAETSLTIFLDELRHVRW